MTQQTPPFISRDLMLALYNACRAHYGLRLPPISTSEVEDNLVSAMIDYERYARGLRKFLRTGEVTIPGSMAYRSSDLWSGTTAYGYKMPTQSEYDTRILRRLNTLALRLLSCLVRANTDFISRHADAFTHIEPPKPEDIAAWALYVLKSRTGRRWAHVVKDYRPFRIESTCLIGQRNSRYWNMMGCWPAVGSTGGNFVYTVTRLHRSLTDCAADCNAVSNLIQEGLKAEADKRKKALDVLSMSLAAHLTLNQLKLLKEANPDSLTRILSQAISHHHMRNTF